MSKTVVYIDGQNFMYRVAENLKNAGLVSDKQATERLRRVYARKVY